MKPVKAWMAWSSGKDSAWALHAARRQRDITVVGLLTTVTEAYGRIAMHGVREELLHAQAAALGLPLHVARIPAPCPNEAYEAAMRDALKTARRHGVTRMVFGDLFLEDIRAYRERQLARIGMSGVFPLWGRKTPALAREMIHGGLQAYLVCLDPRKTPRRFAGRPFDASLLADLPDNVDPCGEHGEFHTFAWNGPMFSRPVDVTIGETVEREGFVFTDLVPSPRRVTCSRDETPTVDRDRRRPLARGRPRAD
ncbi:MAG TPA: ATP-binding protein [Nitrospiria bacterium]|nr:ATP-binding protein [Nitrospiria bacterium]